MISRREIFSGYTESEKLQKPSFILLLGPSGVGKSTLIENIKPYVPIDYVNPVMDRPLRFDEKDKISVSKEEFTKMEKDEEFIIVNNLYGYRYGTPKSRIDEILSNGRVPILDFPLNMVERLSGYKDVLYTIYIAPPTLGTLRQRLDKDKRGDGNDRFERSKRELLELVKEDFVHPGIDAVVINRSLEQTVSKLLSVINARIYS